MSKKDEKELVPTVNIPEVEFFDDSQDEVGLESISLDDISKEQLLEIIQSLQAELESKPTENTYVVEPFVLTDAEMELFAKTEEYQEGTKIGAKLGGISNALISCGFSKEMAMEVAMNYQTLTFNVESIKLQAKTLKRSGGGTVVTG